MSTKKKSSSPMDVAMSKMMMKPQLPRTQKRVARRMKKSKY